MINAFEKTKKILPFVGLGIPFTVMAATDLISILFTFKSILNYLVPILVVVALVMFIWGVIQYIASGTDATKRAEARNLILYGVIGLFAIVAVWGLVEVIIETFSIDVDPGITAPSTDV